MRFRTLQLLILLRILEHNRSGKVLFYEVSDFVVVLEVLQTSFFEIWSETKNRTYEVGDFAERNSRRTYENAPK